MSRWRRRRRPWHRSDAAEAQRLIACARSFRFLNVGHPIFSALWPKGQHSGIRLCSIVHARESRAARLQIILIPTQQGENVQVAPDRGLRSSLPMIQIIDRRMITCSCMYAPPADACTASALSCWRKHSERGVLNPKLYSTGRRRDSPRKDCLLFSHSTTHCVLHKRGMRWDKRGTHRHRRWSGRPARSRGAARAWYAPSASPAWPAPATATRTSVARDVV